MSHICYLFEGLIISLWFGAFAPCRSGIDFTMPSKGSRAAHDNRKVCCQLCFIYPDEAKTISRFGKILVWGLIYFVIMVYYKTKHYLQERKNYHRFKLGLENFKL